MVAKLSDSAGYYIGEISAVADDVVTEPQTLTVALSSAEFVVGENVTATVTPPSGATSSTEYTYVWDYADDKDNGPWTRVSTSSDKQSVTDSLYMSPTVRGKYLRCTVYAPGVMGDVISTDKVGSKVLGGTVTLDRDPAVYKYAETITAAASGYQSDVDPVLTWYRDDSTDPIGSGATYTTGVADIGHVIKCVLTDGNDIRSGIVEADTQPIAKLEWNTMIVEISTLTGEDVGGTVKLGQTLKAQASGAPDDIADPDYHPGTLSYQWFVDGVAIAAPRGLGQTFVPEPTEYKQTITAVAVIANNTCYDIASATSAGAQVVQGDLAGKVQITGANSVGSTLYVNVTQISTGAEPSYQWMRDGMPIDGASSSSYLLTDDDHECSISVVVTDSSNGDDHYYAGSIQSDPTAKVGKTITIVWNAGEGEFEDGLKTITKSAVYASDAVLKATDQPQLPKREGYMLSGWIDSEGERIQFGKTVMPSSDATYTAMWIEMVDVDVPVSLTFNITSSGFVTTETGSLVSYMPESVGVIKLEAVSDADGFSTLFKDLDTNQVALTVAAPDYGATSVFLDEDPKDVAAISSGLVIGAYGTLNLNYGLIAPDITDHVYYSIDHAVKFADLIYTIAPSKYLL